MGGLYTPGCKLSGGSRPPKPSGYAPASSLERPSSATAGSGFVALRGSQVSSTSATSPAPIAPPPDTPPSAGQIPCSPTSKQPLGHAPRRRGQTSASLHRRLRLALQPPLPPEDNSRAAGHRRRGDPANALSPPQTGGGSMVSGTRFISSPWPWFAVFWQGYIVTLPLTACVLVSPITATFQGCVTTLIRLHLFAATIAAMLPEMHRDRCPCARLGTGAGWRWRLRNAADVGTATVIGGIPIARF